MPHGRDLIQILPDLNYRMPDYVLEGTDERLLRVLGKHPEMAYR